MNSCLTFGLAIVICGTLLLGLFLVLLSMPKSKLRSVVFELLGWFTTASATVLVVSPIDLMPDVVPVAGQIDDVLYIVVGIIAAVFAYHQRQERRRLE